MTCIINTQRNDDAEARSIINRYNNVPAHRRQQHSFEDLERLWICETGLFFPHHPENVFQSMKKARGGPLRDAKQASDLVKRYGSRNPKDIHRCIQEYEQRRYLERLQRQRQITASPHIHAMGYSLQGVTWPFIDQPHDMSNLDSGFINQSAVDPNLENTSELRLVQPEQIGTHGVVFGGAPALVGMNVVGSTRKDQTEEPLLPNTIRSEQPEYYSPNGPADQLFRDIDISEDNDGRV